jgi:sortase A
MKAFRVAGTLMIVGGLLACVWALVVWRWQDPFTALYTMWKQHQLESTYKHELSVYHPLVQKPLARAVVARDPNAWVRAETRTIALDAKRYRQSLKTGQPLGRIKVPRLGLDIILVTGTDHDSLTKGPGWFQGTYLPGEHQLIYIAGHRTTYLAPFAHIDALKPGDQVTIELPYATFVYQVRFHKIVTANDIARLKTHGREVVALQACHPRFFATHRYIQYAFPVKVIPRSGRPYTEQQAQRAAASRPAA